MRASCSIIFKIGTSFLLNHSLNIRELPFVSFLLKYFLNRREHLAQPLPKMGASTILSRSIKLAWPWTTAINWPLSSAASARILSQEANQCHWQPVLLGGPLIFSGPLSEADQCPKQTTVMSRPSPAAKRCHERMYLSSLCFHGLVLKRPLSWLNPPSSSFAWSGPILNHCLAAIHQSLEMCMAFDRFSIVPLCFHRLFYRTYVFLYLWRIWSYTYQCLKNTVRFIHT